MQELEVFALCMCQFANADSRVSLPGKEVPHSLNDLNHFGDQLMDISDAKSSLKLNLSFWSVLVPLLVFACGMISSCVL